MSKARSEEHDLFERITEKVNKEPIHALLSLYEKKFPNEITLSGNKPDLIYNLKAAVDAGRIPRSEVFNLLQEWEENGNQLVLYYKPRSKAVLKKCRDSELIASELFGSNWRKSQHFPKLTKLKSGWDVVDFRTDYQSKPHDWIIKIYSYQEIKTIVRELRPADFVKNDGIGLKENEFAIVFEMKTSESVCLARWNDHPQHPLLELRLEIAGRLERFELDVNAIWTRLSPAFEQEDFVPWVLQPTLEGMIHKCKENETLYELGTANLVDSGEWSIRYMPYTENEKIDNSEHRLENIIRVLKEGGKCDRLVMTWLPERSGDLLDKKLRTYAGSRGTNELVIRAGASASAVNYVTDQLRSFAE